MYVLMVTIALNYFVSNNRLPGIAVAIFRRYVAVPSLWFIFYAWFNGLRWVTMHVSVYGLDA